MRTQCDPHSGNVPRAIFFVVFRGSNLAPSRIFVSVRESPIPPSLSLSFSLSSSSITHNTGRDSISRTTTFNEKDATKTRKLSGTHAPFPFVSIFSARRAKSDLASRGESWIPGKPARNATTRRVRARDTRQEIHDVVDAQRRAAAAAAVTELSRSERVPSGRSLCLEVRFEHLASYLVSSLPTVLPPDLVVFATTEVSGAMTSSAQPTPRTITSDCDVPESEPQHGRTIENSRENPTMLTARPASDCRARTERGSS